MGVNKLIICKSRIFTGERNTVLSMMNNSLSIWINHNASFGDAKALIILPHSEGNKRCAILTFDTR
jgi:hypothetical protein